MFTEYIKVYQSTNYIKKKDCMIKKSQEEKYYFRANIRVKFFLMDE
jgi:hypothetical protein